MVSSASHLVVHDMHMQVVAVAAVIVVRSSSDSSNASNEVRADISATVAGDMHAWNSVDITRIVSSPGWRSAVTASTVIDCNWFVRPSRHEIQGMMEHKTSISP